MDQQPPQYYDYPAAAEAAGLTDAQLNAIQQHFQTDYPHDLMLRELHILRACNAIARGQTTFDTLLSHDSRGNVA